MGTVWSWLGHLIHHAAVQPLNTVIEHIRTLFEGDPKTRRDVAFSVAMIALSAKMAKADGVVNDAEIKAFYEIFSVPPQEIRHVEHLYNLAKKDVAGFEYYAKRIYKLCCETGCDGLLLEDVIEGLFYIAKADNDLHDDELNFLSKVAEQFGFSKARFNHIAARHVASGIADPWHVLGVTRDTSFAEARKRYRELVKENHPDQVLARGLPKEFLSIATERMARINHAWDTIKSEFIEV